MGQHIDRLARWLARRGLLEQRQPVLPDRPADRHIFLADRGRLGIGARDPFAAWPIAHRRLHPVERPAQIDRGRPGAAQPCTRLVQRLIRGIGEQGEADAIGGGRADKRCPAHLHGLNRDRRRLEIAQSDDAELVRQQRLVDDRDRAAIGLDPDGAPVCAVYPHAPLLTVGSGLCVSRRRAANPARGGAPQSGG